MRLTSSACAGTSTGTSSSSVRVRLRSGSCSMITSLASVNRRLQKVIVNPGLVRPDCKGGEFQERVSAEMRLIAHRDLSGIRTDHPHWNLQSPACGVYNRDRAISPFWSPGDSQDITVQWMKRVENADVRGIRTQGIVSDCCTILMFTASWPPAASPTTTRTGCAPEILASSFPKTYSA